MKTKKVTKRGPSHAAFWTLLKNVPGYEDRYKDVIKESIVEQYSLGKTCSLSEMYKRYPALYSEMIEAMKGNFEQRKDRYDEERDKSAKRVIASICSWLDKLEYKFKSNYHKIDYAKHTACRAANCDDFNKIPLSKMDAIYSLFCKKNTVDIAFPALDYKVSKH